MCKEIDSLWQNVARLKKKSRTVTKTFMPKEDESDSADDDPEAEAMLEDAGGASFKKSVSTNLTKTTRLAAPLKLSMQKETVTRRASIREMANRDYMKVQMGKGERGKSKVEKYERFKF